jgi:hypothetical protein
MSSRIDVPAPITAAWRALVPPAIRATRGFAALCPATSACLTRSVHP